MNSGARCRVVGGCVLAMALLAASTDAQERGGADDDPQVCAARLSALVPEEPSRMDLPKRCTQPELQRLMECVARARTVEGAHVLIRCLAFRSMDLSETNGEPVIVHTRIPAMCILIRTVAVRLHHSSEIRAPYSWTPGSFFLVPRACSKST